MELTCAAAACGNQSLFPGLGFGAGYKILQRVYKYGGQPYLREHIDHNFGVAFRDAFGQKTGKTMIAATAVRITKNNNDDTRT